MTVLLKLRFGEEAQVAAFFGHYGLEARKVVAHVGVEQVFATEDDAVVGERERPVEFEGGSEGHVAGGAFFVAVHAVLRECKFGVDACADVCPEVSDFAVELERRNLRHVAPVFVLVESADVACACLRVESLFCREFDGSASSHEECVVTADLVNRQNL